MEAALALFAEHGFDATTVDRIAEEAGVSRRSFFRYFPTKEAAFFSGQRRRLGVFRSLVASPLPGESALETVRRAILALAAVYTADREERLLQHRVIQGSKHLMAADLQVDAEWEAEIAQALRRGGCGAMPPETAAIAAGALMGMIRALLCEWYESEGRGDLVGRGVEAFALFARGFGPS
ncbi:MAG: TetR family transcriptional regulator [Myxococcota bacterium]